MKTFGLVNLMPLLKFERVWWNIQSAESSPFMTFTVSETQAAVVSRNAKAGTEAHSGLSNSNLYSRQISGQGSYPNRPLVLAIEHMSEFKSNARTGTGTLDPQIKSLMLYRLSYPGFRKSPTPSPRWYFIIKLLLASNKNMVRLVQGNVVNICIGSETGLPALESRPCVATVARLTPDQKVACSTHVGVKKRLLFHRLFNNKRSQRRLSNNK